MYHNFKSSDMEFDYKWNGYAPMNPGVITATEVTVLNRKDGNQVLSFIRSLGKSWAWNDEEIYIMRAHQLEQIIRNAVPVSIKTFGEIKKWIETFYNVY